MERDRKIERGRERYGEREIERGREGYGESDRKRVIAGNN
jgi:hypothetical protein